MRDVIKRMNDAAAILDLDAMPSHGNSTNTFDASPGNVVVQNERVKTVDNVINNGMAKESIVDTERREMISVRQDLEEVNV